MTRRRLQPDLPIAAAPVPAVYSAKPRKRTIRRSGEQNVRDALGPITKDCELFVMTSGRFSLIDIMEHALAYTGPARLDIATWTAADGDLRRAHAFLLDGRVQQIRLIVDPSFRSRKPDFCRTLVELFGDNAIRTTPLHGKFCAIRNDEWNLSILSSMNLNPNRRIETVQISADPELAAFLSGFTDEVFERSADANFASQSLSQNAHHDLPSRLAF